MTLGGGAASPAGRRRKEARPQEILDAALEVFAAKGFAAARLDEVAARAGVSKGTLYLYFPSKAELFKAVVRQTVAPNIGGLESLVAEFPGSSAALFRALLLRAAERMATTTLGRLPRIIIAEATQFPDLAAFWATEVVDRAQALLRRVVERGVAAGEFSPVAAEATIVLISPILMLTLWNSSLGPATGRTLDPSLVAAEAARLLLDGLRVREESP